ncbi:MAG: diguanylate cyclase domain-containing protein [Oscillospiraceae bacterium]
MLNSSGLIGFCCSLINKEPVKPVIDNLAQLLKESGKYKMLVFQCFEDICVDDQNARGGASIFRLINYYMLDAMIIMPETIKDSSVIAEIAGNCRRNNVPLISVDGKVKGAFNISFGYGEAFGRIVEHLLSVHGCRRIKLVAGYKGNEFSQTRIDCCRQMMTRHGLTLTDSDIMYGDFWEAPTYEAMDRFFETGEQLPDAFVCCNDSMAMAVCLKLNERGYHVPEDVIVTGFDGIETEKFHQPRLTNAVRNNRTLAKSVMDILEEITSGRVVEPYNVRLEYDTVFSESCGCNEPVPGNMNSRLAEFVQTYTSALNYEEYANNIENQIAADPTPDNVRKVLEEYCFGNSMICFTDEFWKNFSGESAGDRPPEFSGFGDMHVFASTFLDGRKPVGTVFPASRIMPQLDSAFGDYMTMYVIPLHFQDYVQGYYITHYAPPAHHNERLYTLCNSLNRCLENMRTHEQLRTLNRRLEFMFTHDQLTQIYNRYGFYKGFRESFATIGVENRDVFIVSIDLNDMKYINDNYGHSAGDDALCLIARALTDAGEFCSGGVICSRFGGDEFVAAKICQGNAKEQAELYRSGFDSKLTELNQMSGKPYFVNVGIGIFCASLSGVDSIDGLIELADRLMYSDKAKHKRHPRN